MPSVSAIMVSRNDGYGGNLVERASYAFNSFLRTVDELVYVDWNSPGPDLATAVRPNLEPALQHKLRVFKITAEFARERVQRPAQDCVEVLGRNIGIRRASGDWIVSTNVDIVCPPQVPVSQLDPNTFYSYERRNVDFALISHFAFRDCEGLAGYLRSTRDQLPAAGRKAGAILWWRDRWSLWDCCGDFQLAHRNVWHAMRGFEESLTARNYADSNVQKKAVLAGFKLEPRNDLLICHLNHGRGTGGRVPYNNAMTALYWFKKTKNRENWGFADISFAEC